MKEKTCRWNIPAALVKGCYACKRMVTCWVIGGVRWARVRYRGSLLIFVAFLCSSFLCFGQFRLLAVHQQWLVVERWLQCHMEQKCRMERSTKPCFLITSLFDKWFGIHRYFMKSFLKVMGGRVGRTDSVLIFCNLVDVELNAEVWV